MWQEVEIIQEVKKTIAAGRGKLPPEKAKCPIEKLGRGSQNFWVKDKASNCICRLMRRTIALSSGAEFKRLTNSFKKPKLAQDYDWNKTPPEKPEYPVAATNKCFR